MIQSDRLDKQCVRRSFERAASQYDQAAVLQREVCDRMIAHLDYLKHQPKVILDGGCGTGYGGGRLMARYQPARLLSIDLAYAMARLARRRRSNWKGLLSSIGVARDHYLCGDLEHLPLRSGSVDMVWSNLVIQWCNDLDAMFKGIHDVLAVNGLFMFSTFGPDTLKELRQAFAEVDDFSHVSRFTDMHDIGDALLRNGFGMPVMNMEYITLTYEDLMGLMRDLKMIGAHNAVVGRRPGLMGKSAWEKLRQSYERFRRDGKLSATYEVIYGHAWKDEESTFTSLPDGVQAIRWRGR